MNKYVCYLHLRDKNDFIGLYGLRNIRVKLFIVTFSFNYNFIFDLKYCFQTGQFGEV